MTSMLLKSRSSVRSETILARTSTPTTLSLDMQHLRQSQCSSKTEQERALESSHSAGLWERLDLVHPQVERFQLRQPAEARRDCRYVTFVQAEVPEHGEVCQQVRGLPKFDERKMQRRQDCAES
eukprot:3390813-Rhodomonas_salina.1